MTKPQRLTLIITISVVVALTLLATGAAVVQASFAGRILPRTSVAGARLSGGNPAVVSQIINDQKTLLAVTKIPIALQNSKQSILATDLGITVSSPSDVSDFIGSTDRLAWLRPGYWQQFFRSKTIPLTFSLTDAQLAMLLESKFSTVEAPQDATLTVNNGTLTVVPDQPGVTIDIASFKKSVTEFIESGSMTTVGLLVRSQTPATITATAAGTVKDEITQALHPVILTGNNKSFTISVADQYNFLAYSTDGGALKWQITEDKLTTFLQTTVAKKLNIKAVQQVIENSSGRMITQGVNGSAVDVATLEPTVFQALGAPTAPATTIVVPFKTVAFNEVHINPSYTLNLFPGLYLDVSLSTQQITIINADTLIGQYGISSGGWKTPTPIGTFYIFNKIKEAYSPDFKLWMPDWNGLASNSDGTGYLGYGIHAVVCWDKACTNREGADHIGHPVSHGCIRVSDDGIGYIYDQVPIGTPVVIHS